MHSLLPVPKFSPLSNFANIGLEMKLTVFRPEKNLVAKCHIRRKTYGVVGRAVSFSDATWYCPLRRIGISPKDSCV